MKKTLLLGLMLLGGLGASAQEYGLADGSTAPDFTITDIEGNEHHLQSYLDEGKTVILYCSAVWCGPCWSFHNTHYLSDIFQAYGPDASDEVVVLYVETDPRTKEGELSGEDMTNNFGSPAAPIGDWITGTPYPIADSDFISEEYVIEVFPTIYRICPQGVGEAGITKQIERDAPQGLASQIGDGCNELSGVEHWARVTSTDLRLCDNEGIVSASIEGYGHSVSTAAAQLMKDGALVATQTFTFETPLEAFEVGTITFDGLMEGGDYEVVLTDVDGAAPLATMPEFITTEFNVMADAAEESSQNIYVVVHTDEFAEEMAWAILDSEGNLVDGMEFYFENADDEETFEYYLTLENEDCYGILLYDAYGDGWTYNQSGGNVPHGITIYAGNNAEGDVLFTNDGNIGALFTQVATFKTNGTLGQEDFNVDGFAIYPNPSNGIFNVATSEAVDITVMDIMGKTVHTSAGVMDGTAINLSNLQSGMYVARIKGANGAEKIEKLVIK